VRGGRSGSSGIHGVGFDRLSDLSGEVQDRNSNPNIKACFVKASHILYKSLVFSCSPK
jgi:hypothetical protein